jgi:hypothetical protein
MSVQSAICAVLSILLASINCRSQFVLNREVCEVAKYYMANNPIEFRCDFTLKNMGRESINITKDNFEIPCTCTEVELINGLIVPGSSIEFTILYTMDPNDVDIYKTHYDEFVEEGGRHVEIPLRIEDTSQEFTLMFNYFLKGIK